MDDDIEMLPGALEMMLRYSDISGFIHCRRRGPGPVINLDCMWDLSACAAFNPAAPIMHEDPDGRPWLAVQWGNFEGALIHRSVVDKIGLPDERFFIGGDDTMYGLEASYRTNVIYLREYGVERKLPKATRTSRMGYYTLLRNRFVIREHLQKLGFPVSPIVFWFSQLVNLASAIRFVLFDRQESNKRQMIGTIIRGLLDGAQGRFGRPPFVRS
jgi:GT2 family glycosyltransferase